MNNARKDEQEKQYIAECNGTGEGCDHTIGCNNIVLELASMKSWNDLDKGIKEVMEHFGHYDEKNGWVKPPRNGDFDDNTVEDFTIHEVTRSETFNTIEILQNEWKKGQAERNRKKIAATMKKEIETMKKLQSKYLNEDGSLKDDPSGEELIDENETDDEDDDRDDE